MKKFTVHNTPFTVEGRVLFLALCTVYCALCTVFSAPTGQSGNAYQYYLKALLLESQGNFASARVEVDRAIELAPESAYLYRTAAELSLRLGQINKAAEEIEKANELDPSDVRALIVAGQINWALGDTEKAEAKLKKALALNPDESEALVSLAGALTPKNPTEAIRLYTDFLTRHPGEVEIHERLAQLYQATGDFDKAKSSWEQVLTLSPNSVRAHLALAQIAEINFDTATAISHYEGVMGQDPTNLPLLLRVGELRYRNNEMAKAQEAFTKAQAISPMSASANFWLALLAEHRGDWAEAIRLLKQVPANNQEPGVLLRLSYYYSQLGRYQDAIKVLKKLSDSDPANTDFLNYLAIAYEQDKQYTSAEKALKRIIDTDPNDPEAHFHLATLFDRTGRFSKAEEELKTAINLKPNFHMALNYLGYSYAERNINLDQAERLVNDAISLDSENAAYMDSMGWVYYRQGRYQKAKDFLGEATRRAQDPLIWEHLGDAELAGGEPVEAILAWDEALRVAPDSKPARDKIRRAMSRISKKEKVGLFVKRALSNFGDIESANGIVQITVCESKPCFESKAQFGYARADELRVEIPGPLTGPVMLLVKKHGFPAKYGAIHPQFQTVEFYVTRAFERIEGLLSSDVFRFVDLRDLEEKTNEKRGDLIAGSGPLKVRFDGRSGVVKELEWQGEKQSDRLTLGLYGVRAGTALPKFLEWQDKPTGFLIRVDFLKPSLSNSISPQTKTQP